MLLRLGKSPLCPNVIKLHEWVEYKRSFVLIFEYPQPCHTLHQHIKNSSDINEEKARWIIRQLIQAVQHCYDRGVFHGDMHSGNILVTETSLKLKLIDFGCAYPISSEGNLSSEYRGMFRVTIAECSVIDHGIVFLITAVLNAKNVSLAGAALCTPPEVMQHATFHANPAYVWAVGLVLFEILHGYLPFETHAKILHGCVQIKPTLSLGKHNRHRHI
ncbi:serine/threonine-protein kinase pim-1-like [Puntigrus tetrazona]|uniref:serine/threonine-protein kinase pim-1-like n=1 Tax=Puntigrus tetrazona TaxID=1606681 RepID=UPI001C897CB5|nr:serine/threonine-protein kinase pim-1-like [Puntigrus tetrazona]